MWRIQGLSQKVDLLRRAADAFPQQNCLKRALCSAA
jgi:hypothetical protein